MAFKKRLTFPNGTSGEYIKIGFLAIDWINRECSAHFVVYTNQAQKDSRPELPLTLVCKLRLQGAKFDEYLSSGAMAALKKPGPDPLRDQLYAAVRVEPIMPGGGLTRDEAVGLFTNAERAD